jgi:hypothetical protein
MQGNAFHDSMTQADDTTGETAIADRVLILQADKMSTRFTDTSR